MQLMLYAASWCRMSVTEIVSVCPGASEPPEGLIWTPPVLQWKSPTEPPTLVTTNEVVPPWGISPRLGPPPKRTSAGAGAAVVMGCVGVGDVGGGEVVAGAAVVEVSTVVIVVSSGAVVVLAS